MPSKRPPVDKRSVSKRDLDRLPKFQEGGFAGSVLNRILPSEQKKIEETAKYYDTYNDLVAKYNKDLEDYKALYAKAETDYKKAFADYQTQGQEFQRTQVDPYNAAVEQYQRDVENYNKAYQTYLDRYTAAEQKYKTDYDAYDKAYQDYLKQYEAYEQAFPAYQKALEEYESKVYTPAYDKYVQDVDAYNRLVEAFDKTYVMDSPDTYDSYRLAGRGGTGLMRNANDQFISYWDLANSSSYFTKDPGSGYYLRRQNPTESRALQHIRQGYTHRFVDPVTGKEYFMYQSKGTESPNAQQRAGTDYYITGQGNNLTLHFFRPPTATAPSAPTYAPPSQTVPEPSFTMQAPTPNLPTFTRQQPTFTREAPVFTLQEPEFNFTATSPTAPKTPEMNPEELQAYQERAQKMAGYRASGLEKAFEMGMLPEIAQYFKRGVM
jgi:tetratricopeptide (TPR) repeat protein